MDESKSATNHDNDDENSNIKHYNNFTNEQTVKTGKRRKSTKQYIILASDQVIAYKHGIISELEMFWYMFEKYIVEGYAIMEINISYRLRKKITQTMHAKYPFGCFQFGHKLLQLYAICKMNNNFEDDEYIGKLSNVLQLIQDVLPLYEVCAIELSKLMQDSFRRFKKTQGCRNLIAKEMSHRMKHIVTK